MINDTMKRFCLLTFLVCFDVGNGWLFDQTLSNNDLIKRLESSHQRAVHKNDKSANSNNDKKRMAMWWDEPDIETAISMLSVRSSGIKSDNTITLTASALYTLDLVWDVSIGDYKLISRGDRRKDGIIAYSEITLTKEELDQVVDARLSVNFPEFTVILVFNISRISIQQRDQNVNIMGALFDGPDYPNRVLNGNIYEFSLQTQRNMDAPSRYLTFQHAFYDPEQVGEEYQIKPVNNVEYESGYMETKIKAHLGDAKPDELLFVHLNNINNFGINSVTNMFTVSAYRYINIPRNQPASSLEFLFFDKSKKVQRFPPTIKYGSLYCLVAGTPAPTLEISKDGQVIDVPQFTYLNIVTYALVPFNGKTLDEVAGTYLCKASNGNKEATQEIDVVGLND